MEEKPEQRDRRIYLLVETSEPMTAEEFYKEVTRMQELCKLHFPIIDHPLRHFPLDFNGLPTDEQIAALKVVLPHITNDKEAKAIYQHLIAWSAKKLPA